MKKPSSSPEARFSNVRLIRRGVPNPGVDGFHRFPGGAPDRAPGAQFGDKHRRADRAVRLDLAKAQVLHGLRVEADLEAGHLRMRVEDGREVVPRRDARSPVIGRTDGERGSFSRRNVLTARLGVVVAVRRRGLRVVFGGRGRDLW